MANQEPERRANNKKDVQRYEVATRRAEALRLRMEGHDYRTIAKLLGVSVSVAHNDVQTAIKDIPAENLKALRELEAMRLDVLWAALSPKIKQGNTRAIEVAIKISERRSKLLGLDEPPRIPVKVITDELMEQVIGQMEDQLRDLE